MHLSRFRQTTLLVLLIAALPLIASPLPGADFSVEPGVALPADVPAALKSLLKPEGVAVKDSAGKVTAEYWTRQAKFEGTPASGVGIRLKTVPEGALIGLVRFPEAGTDFREQKIPAGTYTMRYGLHPEDGNHMGVASSRDFGVLTPVDKDSDPAKPVPFKQLVELTKKVGNPHPTIIRIEMAESSDTPHLWQQDDEHWVLDLDVAGEPAGFVVHGHSEE